MKKQYDVVIIGAGVVGSAIARELSRYKLSIAVLEKNLDVCNETSGRNSAVVHGGFANPTGSLKAKCCVEGNKIMDQLAEELDFPFKRCGKVLVGKVNVDEEPELARQFGVMSIPTVVFLKNGVEFDRKVGVMPGDVFTGILDDNL